MLEGIAERTSKVLCKALLMQLAGELKNTAAFSEASAATAATAAAAAAAAQLLLVLLVMLLLHSHESLHKT